MAYLYRIVIDINISTVKDNAIRNITTLDIDGNPSQNCEISFLQYR